MNQPELDVTGEPCLQYEFDGLFVNVWTKTWRGRRTIEGIALPGSNVDLISMLTDEQIRKLREHCELKLSTSEELADRSDEQHDRKKDKQLDREAA